MNRSWKITMEVPPIDLADKIDRQIVNLITFYKDIPKDSYLEIRENYFEKLIGMGELCDRLSIVNIKLYNLKNEVMQRKDDIEFLAKASILDITLVEERSRLKKCIDEKIISMINNPSYNPEIKSYGDKFND